MWLIVLIIILAIFLYGYYNTTIQTTIIVKEPFLSILKPHCCCQHENVQQRVYLYNMLRDINWKVNDPQMIRFYNSIYTVNRIPREYVA